jgi:hypothetical protein
MIPHPPILRRIALALVAHAGRVLAGSHAFWAEGMKQEADHIPGDWDAFCWSAGCVFASYRQTPGSIIRAFLAILIFYFCYDSLIGPAQAIGCYVHASQSLLNLLARLPDDQVICVSWPAVPVTLQLLSIAVGGLYAMSAIQFIRRQAPAFFLFVLAFAAGLVCFIYEQGMPAVGLYRASSLLAPVLAHMLLSRHRPLAGRHGDMACVVPA